MPHTIGPFGMPVPLGPDCPACRSTMHLYRQEPDVRPSHVRRYFRCSSCAHELTRADDAPPDARILTDGRP